MYGTFNKTGNKDYNLFITESEYSLLESGDTVSGEIDYYWNDDIEKHTIDVILIDDTLFRQKAKLSAKELEVTSWRKFMFKVGLTRKENHHSFYFNCDFLFSEYFDTKVFEQRYCDWLFDKVLIFIKEK